MDIEFLNNIVFSVIWAALALIAFIGVVFFGAWWHCFTGVISLALFWAIYNDKSCDGISVREWIKSFKK